MTSQQALSHGPGQHSHVLTLEKGPGITPAQIRGAAAQLINLFNQPQNASELNIHVLVALAPAELDGLVQTKLDALAASGHATSIPNDPAFARSATLSLFVQVASDCVDGVSFVRRAVQIACRGLGVLREHGGRRLLDNRENFGYRDGVRRARGGPRVPAGPPVAGGALGDGCWLLYQQFDNKIEDFHALSVSQQNDVFGRGRNGEAHANPPRNSHVELQRGGANLPQMRRRGFRFCTSDMREGLSFVAAASSPGEFKNALERMTGAAPGNNGRDRLLDYVDVVEGAVLFAPPRDTAWLEAGIAALAHDSSLDDMRPPVALSDYVVTGAFRRYIELLIEDGRLFDDMQKPAGQTPPGEMDLPDNIIALVKAIHHYAYSRTISIDDTADQIVITIDKEEMAGVGELDAAFDKLRADAKALNAHYGEYLTLVI